MIELTLPTALTLYLCLTLFVVLGVWSYSYYLTRKRKILSNEQTLYICEYCHYAYLEDIVSKVTQCPQCGLFNKSNHYRSTH